MIEDALLLTWALLVVAASPAVAQHRPYATVTSCVNHLAVTGSIYGFSPRDSTEIATHEAVHRRQLAVGCDSVWALWSRDWNAKMEAEAEALCVGMRAAGLSVAQRHARAVQASQWWTQFRGGESFADYLARFDRWCL